MLKSIAHHYERGNSGEASKYLERAIEIYERRREHRNLADALTRLIRLHKWHKRMRGTTASIGVPAADQ